METLRIQIKVPPEINSPDLRLLNISAGPNQATLILLAKLSHSQSLQERREIVETNQKNSDLKDH